MKAHPEYILKESQQDLIELEVDCQKKETLRMTSSFWPETRREFLPLSAVR